MVFNLGYELDHENHKSNIDIVNKLNLIKSKNVKILSFIPVRYAYKEISGSNNKLYKNIMLFGDMLNLKVIFVKRLKQSGIQYDENIFINVRSNYPLLKFQELFKVGASDRLIRLADLGIDIIDEDISKEKRIIYEWDSVLELFDDISELRDSVVRMVRGEFEKMIM